jgi:hypothetical protein
LYSATFRWKSRDHIRASALSKCRPNRPLSTMPSGRFPVGWATYRQWRAHLALSTRGGSFSAALDRFQTECELLHTRAERAVVQIHVSFADTWRILVHRILASAFRRGFFNFASRQRAEVGFLRHERCAAVRRCAPMVPASFVGPALLWGTYPVPTRRTAASGIARPDDGAPPRPDGPLPSAFGLSQIGSRPHRCRKWKRGPNEVIERMRAKRAALRILPEKIKRERATWI